MEVYRNKKYKRPLLLGENSPMAFIRYMYGRTDQLNNFWQKHYDDFLELLLKKKVVSQNGNDYEICARFGSPQKAMRIIERLFEKFKNRKKMKFKVIAKNDEIKILRHENGNLYVFFDDTKEIMKIDDDMKRQLLDLYDKNKDIVNALGMIEEMTSATSSGQYTANAFPNIGSGGEFLKPKETKAQKEVQYSGGGFVKFKPCASPNNTPNCDQGRSIEYPIKTTKHNIISPSLN
jgi:hypothetical protein